MLTSVVELLVHSALETVKNLLHQSGQTVDDLRGMRIFYLSETFEHENLHQGKSIGKFIVKLIY